MKAKQAFQECLDLIKERREQLRCGTYFTTQEEMALGGAMVILDDLTLQIEARARLADSMIPEMARAKQDDHFPPASWEGR